MNHERTNEERRTNGRETERETPPEKREEMAAVTAVLRLLLLFSPLGSVSLGFFEGGGEEAAPFRVVSLWNDEFRSSPGNYAHWLLAHVYPLVVGLSRMATKVEALDFLVSGPDDGLLLWERKYRELLAPWTLRFLIDGGPRDEASMLRSSVPHLSFCTRDYWREAHALAAFVRRRLVSASEEEGNNDKKKIFILLRGTTQGHGGRSGWDVGGLESACVDEKWLEKWLAAGVDIACGSFSRETSLRAVARRLGHATAFIAAHGAGLANAVFLPPGASVFELDAYDHRHHNRFFYAELVRNLPDVSYEKIWLRGRDMPVVHHETLINNCTQRREDGSFIVGNTPQELQDARILPYESPAFIHREHLDDLLSKAAAKSSLGRHGGELQTIQREEDSSINNTK